jgi:Ni/Co efflux regulator RcnB
MKRFGVVTAIAVAILAAALAAAASQTGQTGQTVQTRQTGQTVHRRAAAAGQTVQTAPTVHKRAAHGSSRAYDGLWSVAIRTHYGPCDATYRYPARILGGRVTQADNDFSYQISGAVAASGAIAVAVYRGGQSATGYGRLRGSSGAGRWSAGGNLCYGTWSALRRAAN